MVGPEGLWTASCVVGFPPAQRARPPSGALRWETTNDIAFLNFPLVSLQSNCLGFCRLRTCFGNTDMESASLVECKVSSVFALTVWMMFCKSCTVMFKVEGGGGFCWRYCAATCCCCSGFNAEQSICTSYACRKGKEGYISRLSRWYKLTKVRSSLQPNPAAHPKIYYLRYPKCFKQTGCGPS